MNEGMTTGHCRATLSEAKGLLPGPSGGWFAKVMAHGTMEVEVYAPRGHDPQLPHAHAGEQRGRVGGTSGSGWAGNPDVGARCGLAPRRRARPLARLRRVAHGRRWRFSPASHVASPPLPQRALSLMYRAAARRRLLLRGGAGTWLRVAGPRDPARPSSMVAAVSLLLVCATLFLSACAAAGGSASACGRELPTVEPPQAAPGKNFVLSGGGFGGVCDDSNQPFRADPPRKTYASGCARTARRGTSPRWAPTRITRSRRR